LAPLPEWTSVGRALTNLTNHSEFPSLRIISKSCDSTSQAAKVNCVCIHPFARSNLGPAMITRFHIQNYKALRDVTLDLTRIHVLIGRNDSGKTSILEAIAAMCRSVDHSLPQAFAGAWERHQLIWQGARDLAISLTASISGDSQNYDYHLACSSTPSGRQLTIGAEEVRISDPSQVIPFHVIGGGYTQVYRCVVDNQNAAAEIKAAASRVYDALGGVQSYRWDGRFLALPVAPDMSRRFRMEPSGFGLALCLDDILGYDRQRFTELEDRFRDIFPQIRSIKLIPEAAYKSPVDDPEQVPMLSRTDGKGLYFEFKSGGDLIPARQVSDGVLLVLAYLAVLHLPKPPRLLLIEEPENGVHPKRLQDIVAILRNVVSDSPPTQLLLTTHSPYFVDLLKPEEVTLCKKEEDGSVSVHPLSKSATVKQQLDVFTLGEIWTAEGDDTLVHTAQ
jgi:predicted ATPase